MKTSPAHHQEELVLSGAFREIGISQQPNGYIEPAAKTAQQHGHQSKTRCYPFDWHLTFTEEYKRVKDKLRVVRVILQKELSSLRHGEHLLRGWRDCFECHSALWKGRIEHGDISPRNLMWDASLKVGVLNDFDLTSISGEDSNGGRRTGTITFIALQRIKPLQVVKSPRQFYRHDLESLIWDLIWVCLYFSGSDDIPQGMEEEDVREQLSLLREWNTADTRRAWEVRWGFLSYLKTFLPCQAFGELGPLTKKLGAWVKQMNEDETVESFDSMDDREEMEVIHKQILDIIKDYEISD